MRKALLCIIALSVCFAAADGYAQDREDQDRDGGDRRRDTARARDKAARSRRQAKHRSANQPRRPAQRSKRGRGDEGSPDVLIYQFKHIHVDSFLHTIEQLARSKHVGPHLKDVPHAINEESNTLVMLAPPELTKLMRKIAEGVDKPNPRELRRRDRDREQDRQGRDGRTHRRPKTQRHRKSKSRKSDEQSRRTERPEGRRSKNSVALDDRERQGEIRFGKRTRKSDHRGTPPQRRGHTRPPMVGMLLHPRMARAIKLNEEQLDRIRDIVKDLHGKTADLSKRLRNAREDSRSDKANRRMLTSVRRRMMQLHQEAAEKAQSVLTDDQKKQWESMRKKMAGRMHSRRGRAHQRDDDDDEDDEDDDDEGEGHRHRDRRERPRRDRDEKHED